MVKKGGCRRAAGPRPRLFEARTWLHAITQPMKVNKSAEREKTILSLWSAMSASLPAASVAPVKRERKAKIKAIKSSAAAALSSHRSPV